MDKRSYFLNNPTGDSIRITELNISLPPGISNVFELNPDLNFEQIDYSLRHGTLRAAMENNLCYTVPDFMAKTISKDVILRNPCKIQVFPTRTKFDTVTIDESSLFDSDEDAELFSEDDVKPARQLEEELKKSSENVQAIEATVKEANLPEKPLDNRYTPPVVKEPEIQQKIKNDMQMGYETCNGTTASGGRCMRRAKTGKKFCGLHAKQG